MGEYFTICNFDRKEFLNPGVFGHGHKPGDFLHGTLQHGGHDRGRGDVRLEARVKRLMHVLGIVLLSQLGRHPQLEMESDLAAEEAVGFLQPLRRLLALLGLAVHRPVDPRLAEVGRHLHAGDGDQPDARVAHAAGEELAEELLHQLPDALRPVVHAHSPSSGFCDQSCFISE